MKWVIASDIHGSALYCRKLFACMDREEADRLLLLGDLLYHGPRNDLPAEYAPKEVITMLNAYREKILCVRGNCDTEVDQMVLDFPIMADYAALTWENRLIYATHGHIFNKDCLPQLQKGDILLYGHSHVPLCEEKDGVILLNPGSVSIPKSDSWHGYMTMENGLFRWLDLDGKLQMEYKIR